MIEIKKIRTSALLLAAFTGFSVQAITAEAIEYGKPGDPIHLTVGFQPYFTPAWSGVVLKGKEFWKKYLPAGSTVEFQVGLQGAVIVGQMLADKQQIGYLGDMPALTITNKEKVADVRLVGVTGTSTQSCDIVFVRKEAPEFKSAEEAAKWLNGKTVASGHGSCADRFARVVFKQTGIEPAQYLNQSLEVISSNFRVGKLDGAVVWEPTASQLEEKGIARRVASGADFGERDGAFVTMRHELMEKRPDVAKGWMEAELDAQLFMADPANADEVAGIIKAETTGLEQSTLWYALYGERQASQGGRPEKLTLNYSFTPDMMAYAQRAYSFLYSIKRVSTETLRDNAIDNSLAEAVLKERGLTSPVGVVKALPLPAKQ